jgi:L-ribulose-5-phosphate 4-epimerase
MSSYDEYRKQVLAGVQSLVDEGLLKGLGGNVSIRIEGEDAVVVTPSQMDYNKISIDDICVVDFDLNPIVDNGLRASIETGMHVSVYKNRPDAGAVVHTHQVYASIFSLINEPIPSVFDEVSRYTGHIIDVVSYGLSGSPQLLENITAKLDNRCNCYILQNHGALAIGKDLDWAIRNALLMEKCATVYYHAMLTGKDITQLPENIKDLMKTILKNEQDAEIARKEEAGKKEAS